MGSSELIRRHTLRVLSQKDEMLCQFTIRLEDCSLMFPRFLLEQGGRGQVEMGWWCMRLPAIP